MAAVNYVARVDVSVVHDSGRSKGKRVLVKAGDSVPATVSNEQARLLTGAGLLVPGGAAPTVSRRGGKAKVEESGAPSSPAEPPAGDASADKAGDGKGGSAS